MKPKWQDATIIVPAGVRMTRMNDGEARVWSDGSLRFRAYRAVNDDNEPTDDVWQFYWLSKLHQVPQSDVTIESIET
jgi:hypothetical protein